MKRKTIADLERALSVEKYARDNAEKERDRLRGVANEHIARVTMVTKNFSEFIKRTSVSLDAIIRATELLDGDVLDIATARDDKSRINALTHAADARSIIRKEVKKIEDIHISKEEKKQ